jgi:transposase-like protein
MDIHENARTTPRSRMLMIERLEAGWTVAAVAAAIAVDPKTVRKWRDRYRADRPDGSLVASAHEPGPADAGG